MLVPAAEVHNPRPELRRREGPDDGHHPVKVLDPAAGSQKIVKALCAPVREAFPKFRSANWLSLQPSFGGWAFVESLLLNLNILAADCHV